MFRISHVSIVMTLEACPSRTLEFPPSMLRLLRFSWLTITALCMGVILLAAKRQCRSIQFFSFRYALELIFRGFDFIPGLTQFQRARFGGLGGGRDLLSVQSYQGKL